MNWEWLGMLGSVMFGIAVMPAAYAAIRDGKSSMEPKTAWLLITALTAYTTYLFGSFGIHLPFFSGVSEIGCWWIILHYHYWPRRTA